MSRFVTGQELATVVYDILFEAKQHLLLVSPYIKLDAYFREILDRHLHNPELQLTVVFGKNEGNITRSVSRVDLDYFTRFPNVTLVYAPALHGKYYGNEAKGVVTSINLYDYSFHHNIEFGVYSENTPLVDRLLDRQSIDDQAFGQAMRVATSHDVIFARRPVYKLRSGLMAKLVGSAFGGKDYLEPVVLFDAIEEILHNWPFVSQRLAGFPKEINAEQLVAQVRPTRQEVEARTTPRALPAAPRAASAVRPAPAVPVAPYLPSGAPAAPAKQGYCIRTGTSIPFDPDRPFSYNAFRKWAEFGNDEYPERFCHRAGQPSHGQTSKRYPILYTRL